MKIKLFDDTLPLPQYQTDGAVGLDLYARQETVIPAGGTALVALNVAVELPEGCWGLLASRSSLQKKGLIPANGVGIIDPDYCGDTDEYRFPLHNLTSESVTLERGERIAQLLVLPAIHAIVHQVTKLTGPNRGGFGTTGEI